ncbi:thymidylate synthase [Sinirhodobacter sp. WL0062]|uniref:Thymidylate synthase n=1 Tax=Rhodobacter flavimaris TaxID=2907145 RepID=A0ABS8YX46_9RHOB|nr:thymidylate synthase [Sinirhodobacter sp. WL0062]MCE5973016.1 thymidylate synthase [Sinirhodobacter sp. WL0062]
MSKHLFPLVAVLALAACSGPAIVDAADGSAPDGSTDSSGDGGTLNGADLDTPTDLLVNLKSVTYDPSNETLQVEIVGLDSSPSLVPYVRDPDLDVAGYEAYRVQEDALDRLFIALAKTSDDGAVTAVTVADGGQFNKYFAGGIYGRDGDYDPASGQVSYAGSYAAVTNISADPSLPTNKLIDPGAADPALWPRQAARIEGKIFLDANFSDNLVNGAIYDRVLLDVTDTPVSIGDVILVSTDIATDGTFAGAAEDPDQTVIGSYGGIFGGTGSSSVAGAVHLQEHIEGVENEQEHGIFAIGQCEPLTPGCGVP